MGGVSESPHLLSVHRGRVRDSRSTPYRLDLFGDSDGFAPDLHLEGSEKSEAVEGRTFDLCIQLASMEKRGVRSREAGVRMRGFPQSWRLRLASEASEFGAVAQLGERLICIQEVAGSIPTSSTRVGPLGP